MRPGPSSDSDPEASSTADVRRSTAPRRPRAATSACAGRGARDAGQQLAGTGAPAARRPGRGPCRSPLRRPRLRTTGPRVRQVISIAGNCRSGVGSSRAGVRHQHGLPYGRISPVSRAFQRRAGGNDREPPRCDRELRFPSGLRGGTASRFAGRVHTTSSSPVLGIWLLGQVVLTLDPTGSTC